MFPFTDVGKTIQACFTGEIDFASAQWHGSLQFAKQKMFHQKQTIFTLHMPGITHILQTHTLFSFLLSGKKEKTKPGAQTQQENMAESSSHVNDEEDHPLQSEA